MGVWLNRGFGTGDDEPAGHAEMNDPLGIDRVGIDFAGVISIGAELADDVLSGAVHRAEDPAFKSFGLFGLRGFEWLTMGAEPGLYDAVATHQPVYPAGDRFHLWKLRHGCILERFKEGARHVR